MKKSFRNLTRTLTALLLATSWCLAEPPPERNWTPTFEDNFNSIDLTNWDVQDQIQRKGGWNYSNNVTIVNSNLVITTRIQDDRMTTGFLDTKGSFDQKYGYFETRLKDSNQGGLWSGFWLMPEHIYTTQGTGRDGCEIDIAELAYMDGLINFALHYDGYYDDHQKRGAQPFVGDITQYHIYGFQWTPTKYTWYVDGRIMWEETDSEWISQVDQHVILSTEIDDLDWVDGHITNAILPAKTYFDYVRIYADNGPSGQPALPSPVNGTNLSVNGGFENGTANWDSKFSTLTSEPSIRHEGSKSLKVTDREVSWNAPTQDILSTMQSSGGDHFAFSMWIKIPSGYADGIIAFTIRETGGNYYSKNMSRRIRTDEWTRVTGMFYLPMDSLDFASVSLRTADTQDYYVDEFTVTPVTFAEGSSSGIQEGVIYRLKNQNSANVLTINNTSDYARVYTAPLNPSWGSQKWIFEKISEDIYRIKCVWGGRYLNINTNTDYSNVSIAPYREWWGSQKWAVESVGGNVYQLKCLWGNRYMGGALGNWQKTYMSPYTDGADIQWEIEPVN